MRLEKMTQLPGLENLCAEHQPGSIALLRSVRYEENRQLLLGTELEARTGRLSIPRGATEDSGRRKD